MSEQQPEQEPGPEVAVARPGVAGGGGQAPPQGPADDDQESGD